MPRKPLFMRWQFWFWALSLALVTYELNQYINEAVAHADTRLGLNKIDQSTDPGEAKPAPAAQVKKI